MKYLIVGLDDEVHATFKSLTAAARTSMSKVIVQAVTDYNAGKYRLKISPPASTPKEAKPSSK